MRRIYVAGPYSHPDPAVREGNTHAAMSAGFHLLEQGHAPFIPHLSHYFDVWAQQQGVDVPYETYMAWDAAYLSVCDGVLVLGHSPGVEKELAQAERLGLPVLQSLTDLLPPGR
jgi:hypothetical protein